MRELRARGFLMISFDTADEMVDGKRITASLKIPPVIPLCCLLFKTIQDGSLPRLAAHGDFHQTRRVFGSRKCGQCSCPCQKKPWTKTAGGEEVWKFVSFQFSVFSFQFAGSGLAGELPVLRAVDGEAVAEAVER